MSGPKRAICLFPPFFSARLWVFFPVLFFYRAALASRPCAPTRAGSKFARLVCRAAHLSSAVLPILPHRLPLCQPDGRVRGTKSHGLWKTVDEQNFTVWWFTTASLRMCCCFFRKNVWILVFRSWFGTRGNTEHCVLSTSPFPQYKLGRMTVNAQVFVCQLSNHGDKYDLFVGGIVSGQKKWRVADEGECHSAPNWFYT